MRGDLGRTIVRKPLRLPQYIFWENFYIQSVISQDFRNKEQRITPKKSFKLAGRDGTKLSFEKSRLELELVKIVGIPSRPCWRAKDLATRFIWLNTAC